MLTIIFGMVLSSSFAAQDVMKLTIQNRSGYPDDQVYFLMICQTPLGYLDFRNHVLVETPSFSLNVATMVATLAQLKTYSSDGTATISCPAMGSSRIYFCLGQNFDHMGTFPSSGPEMGTTNPVPFGKFEVDLSHGGYLNSTDVDFFSIAYTLTVTKNSGEVVTVGITNSSQTIFEQFEAIPSPADSAQQYGNQNIFKACIIRNANSEVVRVLAPKTVALSQVSATASLPQMFTHFLDDYVNNYCWKPGRTFSFSSKLASDTATYYGRVSDDGLTLYIYTDAAMTIPYTVASLPRPSNDWGSPDFNGTPGYWHNVGKNSTLPQNIDWGYLLYGQDGYHSGPGAYWITNPVAMAIPVSIVRGVMHLDNGTVDWKDSSKYYLGTNGVSTSASPIFYYGQILHRYGISGRVYALSFDDIYGNDSGMAFTDPAVSMTIYPFRSESTSTVTSLTGDVDGDHLADLISVSGTSWYVWFSSAQYLVRGGPYAFNISGTPVTGDVDGDRLADIISVMGTSWYVWFSSAQYLVRGGPYAFDVAGTPVTGDVDGDHLADIISVSGTSWYVWFSSAQYLVRGGPYAFNVSGTPVTGDIDGDGLADIIVVSGTSWYVWFSSAQYLVRGGPYEFNVSGTPVTGDVDGDRLADIIIVSGTSWYVWFSSAQYLVRGGPYNMTLP